MNIVVKTSTGKTIVRPDTTWEKDNEDFYPPEFVNRLSYTPVLFARVSKPGRSVGRNFANRYYDCVGYGVLLYPEDMLDGSEEAYACASCLDHTSFLPYPSPDKSVLDQAFACKLSSTKEGQKEEELFSFGAASHQMVQEAIAEVTRFIYIRTGDLIAIELQERQQLCTREDGSTNVRAITGEETSLDFNIIF